ncbi:MAG: hypothetical protein F4Y37_02320 [Caldilineaceae bacterium SB0664_bin_22]|nr:hypothetical protein [Caldilineaceae bacterium SB0664_bin_22]
MLIDERKQREDLNIKFKNRSSEYLIAATTIWQERFDTASLRETTMKQVNRDPVGAVLVPTSRNNSQIAGRRVRDIRDLCTDLPDKNIWVRNFLEVIEELCFESAGEANVRHRAFQQDEWKQPSTPGIYVYSLQHYVDHPNEHDPINAPSRTLFKVGYSTVDAYIRAQQSDKTFVPERPVLYRIYQPKQFQETVDKELSDDQKAELGQIEKKFHDTLKAFGHIDGWGGGTEWFLTSVEALDQLAVVMELHIEYPESSEDDA